jgi:predicted permease
MQVAMSLVLLVGAQLMLTSVQRLRGVDPGLKPDGVLTMSMTLERTASASAARQFYQQVVEQSAALPGALSVGLTNNLPIEHRSMSGSSFSIESKPLEDKALPPVAYYKTVTPGYFETMAIPLRAGRAPEWRDSEGRPRMIWINETFSQRFLDGRGVGEHIRFGSDSIWSEIAGVVGDVRQAGLREEIQPMAFYALGAAPDGVDKSVGTVVVRAQGDPTTLASALRSIVARANAAVPVVSLKTMDEVISSSLSQTSFTMTLLTIAALVSLALGVVGLYGVISYVVSQRRNEIGVRMALGARPAQIRRMVLRQAAILALAGIVVGLGVAVGVTRLMESLLFGISARDPWIFAGAAVVLVLVSLVASDLPARRAARVQPIEALQAE